MRIVTFLIAMIFFTFPSNNFAQAKNITLHYGYQTFNFPFKTDEIWEEKTEIYFQGYKLQLTKEEIQKLNPKTLDIRSTKQVNTNFIKNFLKEYLEKQIFQEASSSQLTLNENNKINFNNTIQQGQGLNINISTEIIKKAVEENITSIDISVDTYPAKLIIDKTLQEKGIKEIIAIGVSDFSGSSKNRIHNIDTAVHQFHGVIIPKGEKFSFNNTLGDVGSATGYKKELVIRGDETVPDWGGGVCQVSTTLFRSAMLAGLDIEKRRNHSYAVSYYEPAGSDATIYIGSQDFQFTNTTNSDLALHVHKQDQKLVFTILGTHSENTTQLFGPYIYNHVPAPATKFLPSTTLADGEKFFVSPAHNGFTSLWFRKRNDNMEQFKSIYQARPKVYKVGGLNEVKIGNL